MLSGLASYFFGGSEQVTGGHSEESGAASYTTTETEGGDWLIVDATRRRSVASTSEEGDPMTREQQASPVTSVPSSPTPIAYLDGSWYITPPPCFMADSPANMETSPMENLLIEHPSMSVYVGTTSRLSLVSKRRGHRAKAFRRLDVADATAQSAAAEEESVANCHDLAQTSAEEVAVPLVHDEPSTPSAQSHSATVHCPRQVAAGAGELLFHIEGRARFQKALREKQTKLFHHRQLERLNKVQEYQSLGKRQHRKDFMKRHSGANNNRKC